MYYVIWLARVVARIKYKYGDLKKPIKYKYDEPVDRMDGVLYLKYSGTASFFLFWVHPIVFLIVMQ